MDKKAVQEVITEKIKPGLESHGGDIELINVKEDSVHVRLTGACGCCPHAQMTLKMGVEQILKESFPELKEVIAVE